MCGLLHGGQAAAGERGRDPYTHIAELRSVCRIHAYICSDKAWLIGRNIADMVHVSMILLLLLDDFASPVKNGIVVP